MNVTDAAQLAIDPQALGSLKGIAKKDDEKALRKVAQEFEGLLLNQVMKSMRNASFGDDMFESDTTRTFTGMLDQQYVQDITRGSGLGLADMIVRQVQLAQGTGVKNSDPTADKSST
ncbi:MAG: rod-binding protein [Betaproteobacteria bacterium]|nr:rod-binding protein [Betaproteobacteria bacterium]MBL8533236.1 rod-binding protein [Betaproteobacteria bacterium]